VPAATVRLEGEKLLLATCTFAVTGAGGPAVALKI
jgi:hypothetical protein